MHRHCAQAEVKVRRKNVRRQSDCLRVNDRDNRDRDWCYVHTTDSHGGIKVCDSSHEAISYPALCCPCSLQVSLESRRRDEGDVHGRYTSDKEGVCLGCVWDMYVGEDSDGSDC